MHQLSMMWVILDKLTSVLLLLHDNSAQQCGLVLTEPPFLFLYRDPGSLTSFRLPSYFPMIGWTCLSVTQSMTQAVFELRKTDFTVLQQHLTVYSVHVYLLDLTQTDDLCPLQLSVFEEHCCDVTVKLSGPGLSPNGGASHFSSWLASSKPKILTLSAL